MAHTAHTALRTAEERQAVAFTARPWKARPLCTACPYWNMEWNCASSLLLAAVSVALSDASCGGGAAAAPGETCAVNRQRVAG